MERRDLQPGHTYALRRTRALTDPLQEVEFLEYVPRARKAKVRHVADPHPGLVEYVTMSTLLCPWKESPRLLRDEEQELTLRRSVAGDNRLDQAVRDAVNVVFAAAGEDVYVNDDGTCTTHRDAIERLAARAGMKSDAVDRLTGTYPAYRDRHRRLHLPDAALIDLARAFAAADPAAVHLYVEAEEEKYRAEGYLPGSRYMHDLLLKDGPAYALVRQWAGHEHDLTELRREVGRLQGLVQTAVVELKRCGEEQAARRLELALRGM